MHLKETNKICLVSKIHFRNTPLFFNPQN